MLVDLREAGIDYDDVTETLEREGVQKFIDSFTELKQGIAEKRDALAVGVTVATDVVERIWARDPTVWTGGDEAQWLGWLDEPQRMLEQVDEIVEFANEVVSAGAIDDVVVLGMGGSSLAPEVMRRTFGAERFHVLDTTHPKAIRALESQIDVERTLFLSASKSGTTLETRSHTAYFLERGGQFAAITDPGLGPRAVRRRERVPARLPRRADDRRALLGAVAVRDRARGADGHRREAAARARGRDAGGVPARGGQSGARARAASRQRGERRPRRRRRLVRPLDGAARRRVDRQGRARASCPAPDDPNAELHEEVRLPDPYELGQEFFRWEFAVAVAGSIDRHQPVRPARRAGGEGQDERGARGGRRRARAGRVARRAASRRRATATTSASRRSSIPRAWTSCSRSSTARARAGTSSRTASGRATSTRRASSTRAGRTTGLFLQVVDDTGDELPIPGRDFGFARLIRAQAAGDYESLKERGRRVGEDGRSDAARDDRPRPHGRQHGRRASSERGHDVKTYDPNVEHANGGVARRAARPARRAARVLADDPRRRRSPRRRSSELLDARATRATRSSTAATRTSATRSAATRDAQAKGIHFVDAGMSGGIWGLENGYCLMVGGDDEPVQRLEPIFMDLAPEDGYAHVGASGAGHFMKMVHNGIEYGLMQAYAEGFEVLEKSEFDLDLARDRRHLALRLRRPLVAARAPARRAREGRRRPAAHQGLRRGLRRGPLDDPRGDRRGRARARDHAALYARFASRQDESFAAKIIAALRNEFGGHAVKSANDRRRSRTRSSKGSSCGARRTRACSSSSARPATSRSASCSPRSTRSRTGACCRRSSPSSASRAPRRPTTRSASAWRRRSESTRAIRSGTTSGRGSPTGMRYIATEFDRRRGRGRSSRAAWRELDEERGTAGNRLFYFAVPPSAIGTIVDGARPAAHDARAGSGS